MNSNIKAAIVGLFLAEIANEQNGGVSPATLGSVFDSFDQMPTDVFFDLNPGTRSVNGLCTYEEVNRALNDLSRKRGSEALVSELLSDMTDESSAAPAMA